MRGRLEDTENCDRKKVLWVCGQGRSGHVTWRLGTTYVRLFRNNVPTCSKDVPENGIASLLRHFV